ncbi:hypothetical protein NBRC10513v2_002897 [Rhodotorula toruloides]|uniref:Uncharacterized protein n=1 Tax=Rhodotorula toruloides TaxID=5286 RepID=A0A0K3CE52_RHOTO|nr:hypothetical protein AAT19DRAFT_14047 [Rhodotorula toruloides]
MAFIFRGYLRLLQRWTLPTQMATASVTAGTGDLIWQKGFEKKEWSEVEFYKTRRLMMYGGLIFAPIANRWHWVLSNINLRHKVATVLARTATDLTFFSPFATCLFYVSQGAMEGRPFRTEATDPSTEGIYERLEDRLFPTVLKQWAVFGPANLINLSIVPLYARPPFMNFVSIGWNTFLASAQNRGGIPPPNHVLSRDMQISVAAAEVME